MPDESLKTKGLLHRYDIHRTDGRDRPGAKHDGCDLFVLDLTHDPFAIAAITAYADACMAEYPVLAQHLRDRYGLLMKIYEERGVAVEMAARGAQKAMQLEHELKAMKDRRKQRQETALARFDQKNKPDRDAARHKRFLKSARAGKKR